MLSQPFRFFRQGRVQLPHLGDFRAIRLLKKLEREERFATPEEQAVLAQYVGWGGLADCFDERHSKYAELKALLDEDEYAAARESTLTAFWQRNSRE